MANFTTWNQIEDWEYSFKMKVAAFIKGLVGDDIDVFFLEKPWPESTKPSVGFKIISYQGSGWGSFLGYDPVTNKQYVENNSLPTVEMLAIRGNPLALMEYLRQALYSYEDYKYEKFIKNNIGFLSSTSPTEANTIFDGAQTEYRARMLCNFSLCLRSFDPQEITKIEKVIIRNKVKAEYGESHIEYLYEVLALPDYYTINDLYDFIAINGLPQGGDSTWINTWNK